MLTIDLIMRAEQHKIMDNNEEHRGLVNQLHIMYCVYEFIYRGTSNKGIIQ